MHVYHVESMSTQQQMQQHCKRCQRTVPVAEHLYTVYLCLQRWLQTQVSREALPNVPISDVSFASAGRI